jgi:hypothetical protein
VAAPDEGARIARLRPARKSRPTERPRRSRRRRVFADSLGFAYRTSPLRLGFRQPIQPASPASPEPRRRRVAGSGTCPQVELTPSTSEQNWIVSTLRGFPRLSDQVTCPATWRPPVSKRVHPLGGAGHAPPFGSGSESNATVTLGGNPRGARTVTISPSLTAKGGNPLGSPMLIKKLPPALVAPTGAISPAIQCSPLHEPIASVGSEVENVAVSVRSANVIVTPGTASADAGAAVDTSPSTIARPARARTIWRPFWVSTSLTDSARRLYAADTGARSTPGPQVCVFVMIGRQPGSGVAEFPTAVRIRCDTCGARRERPAPP